MKLLLALTSYGTYLQALGSVTAPFLAAEFGLDDAGITAMAGWISLGSFGTVLLTRRADRHGRRGLVLLCFGLLPLLSLASAVAPGVVWFAVAQIGVAALLGALFTGLVVVLVERASVAQRAAGQAWFGLASAAGGGVAIGLAAATDQLPFGWRGLWLVAALPALGLWSARNALRETERFTHARERGQTATSRARDLFSPALRRRSIALLVISALRPIAFIATSTWPFYHMVKTLGLSPPIASLVFFVGGGLGQIGNLVGARLANGWGRRPTAVSGSLVAIVSGVAFFWVTPGAHALAGLIALMTINQGATAAFSVGDRLLGAELFPTPLRATFAGVANLMGAGAGLVASFGLSLLAAPLGGLVPAITWLSIATFVPATVVFLLAVPETGGLSVEQAAREDAEIRP
jgi:MFS transporter, putative metabolite:H+ symporter